MKHSIILCLTLLICFSGFSQIKSDNIVPTSVSDREAIRDTIQYQKNGMGYKFTLNNETLTLDKLGNVMQDNPTSMEFFKKAKGTFGIISVLSYAGGFLIGYPLGTLLGGREQPNWTLAVIGCGLIGIAIPITSGADKNLLKAVQVYNQGKPVSLKNNYEIKLGVNQNGLALAILF